MALARVSRKTVLLLLSPCVLYTCGIREFVNKLLCETSAPSREIIVALSFVDISKGRIRDPIPLSISSAGEHAA